MVQYYIGYYALADKGEAKFVNDKNEENGYEKL